MPVPRIKHIKHLVVFLLGAFLLSVPCFGLGAFEMAIFNTDTIVISGYPGDWVKATNKPSSYNYNNMLKCSGQYNPFYVELKATDLVSGGNTITVDRLKFLCTYVNFYDLSSDTSSPGQGDKWHCAPEPFADFTTSYEKVYLVPTAESGTGDEAQCQFQYAVAIPADKPPGVYTGQILYQMRELGGVTTTGSVNVSVTVKQMFQLSIDRGTIDFEEMLPGNEKENVPVEGVVVTAKCDTGNPWFLKISNNSPLTSGPDMIPNENFKWYGWSDGTGRWYGTGEDALSLTPTLVYSSGAGENNNLPDGTKNHLKFKLKIPPKQRAGKYMSTVKLTLTE